MACDCLLCAVSAKEVMKINYDNSGLILQTLGKWQFMLVIIFTTDDRANTVEGTVI